MAHIDKWEPASHLNIDMATAQAVKEDQKDWIWQWYKENKDTVIIRFLFWKWTIEDVVEIFFDILGEKPEWV